MFRALRNSAPAPEQRAMQVTPWGAWEGTTGTAAGMNVSEDTAYKLLAVYGSVQLISETIATLPRDIYRTIGPDDEKEEVTNKPRWFEQPNSRTDIIEFLSQSLNSLLIDGNAYWAYSTDLNFAPTEIHVLNPKDVVIQTVDALDDTGRPTTKLVYLIKGQPFNGRLLHIKGLTRPGKLKGLSPIDAAMQSIGIGLATQEFAGNFYKNGTTVTGVIQVPGKLTTDQARDLKSNWSRQHSGVQNAHLPGVITDGAEWKQISVTPEQAQFLETQVHSAGTIASMVFLLDPSMLGIAVGRGQNMTYANLEQRGIHLAQFTLMRWIIRLERAFTFLLPKPQFMKFNVDAIQRADLLTRAQAHRISLGPNQAWQTVNEVREIEDTAPLPGFDELAKPAAAAPPVVPPAPQAPPVTNNITLPAMHFESAPPNQIHNHIPAQLPFEPTPIFVSVPPAEPVIHNHVDAAQVTVEAARAPDVHVDVAAALPADVTVNVPDITPIVHTHVEAPTVNVAAAKSPIVHNHIDAPRVVRKQVIYNEEDRIVAVEEKAE